MHIFLRQIFSKETMSSWNSVPRHVSWTSRLAYFCFIRQLISGPKFFWTIKGKVWWGWTVILWCWTWPSMHHYSHMLYVCTTSLLFNTNSETNMVMIRWYQLQQKIFKVKSLEPRVTGKHSFKIWIVKLKTSEGIQLIKYVGVKTASPDKWFGTLLFQKSNALAASIKCLFFPFATSFCCQVFGHELWCTIQFSRKQSPNHFFEEY